MPDPMITEANKQLFALQSQMAGGAQRVFSREGIQEAPLFGEFGDAVELEWNGEELKALTGRRARTLVLLFGLQAERSSKPITPYKTGTLRRSIHSAVLKYRGRTDQRRAEAQQELGGKKIKPTALPDGFSLLFGSWVNYAIYVELGTSSMTQRPFLRTGIVDASQKAGLLVAQASRVA